MLTRRKWVFLAASALTAACVTRTRSDRPRMGLQRALQVLATLKTESRTLEEFGEPNGRVKFNPDSPSDSYLPNRGSRSSWKHLVISAPEGVLDTLPSGTELLLYEFTNSMPINPTVGVLFVCVDANHDIVGWLVDRTMNDEGHFGFDRSLH